MTSPCRQCVGRGAKSAVDGSSGYCGQVRIAILDHTAAIGGAELALVRLLDTVGPDIRSRVVLFSDGPLVELLRRHGHQVAVEPLGELVNASRHEAGRLVVRTLVNSVAVLPFTLRLGLRLRRMRPDLIHTTSLKADLIGVVAAAIAGRPLVWHIHDRIAPDYLPMPTVRLIRFLARHVPCVVIVNSQATAATLPGARGLVIAPPGFSPDQPRAIRAIPDDPPVVGIIGRISPTKGQLEFVQAAAVVAGFHPQVRFRIIGAVTFGETDYQALVRDEAVRLGIDGRIEWLGHVGDATAELDRLSVCVHASPTPEPFGQVIVEAMVRHVPVVATRGGGATEIVVPEPGTEPLGWLVEPYDVAGLAASIIEALDDPAEAAGRAERAWLSATERFPIARTAQTITEVWQRVARVR